MNWEESRKIKFNEFIKDNIKVLEQMHKPLQRMMERNNFFTTERIYESVTVEKHKKGYYYKFTATQSSCNVFVTFLGEIIRKPRNSKGEEVFHNHGYIR